MINDQFPRQVPSYFVLTDSHGKYVPTTISTPSYSIQVMAVSGLKWIDHYHSNLSALSVLSSDSVHQRVSTATAIMFLIGTNSVRCTPAATIITQITQVLHAIRTQHIHLSEKHSITIVASFPCLKPLYPLNTVQSLMANINQYNSMLLNLADALNFTILDFHVSENHLAFDRMHLARPYSTLVEHSIIDYVEHLSSLPTIRTFSTTSRSVEAKARRNQRRHEKQAHKRQQQFFTRPIHSSWSVLSVKNYLHDHNIKFAKIPPIYRNTLRIQFNNPFDQQLADASLSQETFLQPYSFDP